MSWMQSHGAVSTKTIKSGADKKSDDFEQGSMAVIPFESAPLHTNAKHSQ